MAEKETVTSKWFWWVMSIVSAVIAAMIITLLNLGNAPSNSNGVSSNGMPPQAQSMSTTAQSQTTTTDYSGTYSGQAVSAEGTANVTLKFNEADLANVDTTVQATWAGALNGSGPLNGTLETNTATLSGQIDFQEGPWNVNMSCTFRDASNITCNYQLLPIVPSESGSPQATFSATKT